MDNKEEDGVDDDASDRDTRQTPSGAGRWKGRGGFGAHSHNQYYGGHRDPGAQADRGQFDFRSSIVLAPTLLPKFNLVS